MHLALTVFARKTDDVLHSLRADGLTAACHGEQCADGARRHAHVFRLTGDLELLSAADDGDLELMLEQLDVFVERAEHCHQQLGLFNRD